MSEPDVGDPTPCRERFGLAWTACRVVRRRAPARMVEAARPLRVIPTTSWDQRRRSRWRSPAGTVGSARTGRRGWFAAFRAFGPDRSVSRRTGSTRRWLGGGSSCRRPVGRLVPRPATFCRDDGRCTSRSGRDCPPEIVTWEHDLAAEAPHRTPPPPEALVVVTAVSSRWLVTGVEPDEVLTGRYQGEGWRLLGGDLRRGLSCCQPRSGEVLEVIRTEDRNSSRRRAAKRRTTKRHTLAETTPAGVTRSH